MCASGQLVLVNRDKGRQQLPFVFRTSTQQQNTQATSILAAHTSTALCWLSTLS